MITGQFLHHKAERRSGLVGRLDESRAYACLRARAGCALAIMELILVLGGALAVLHLRRSPLLKHHLHRGLPLIVMHFS